MTLLEEIQSKCDAALIASRDFQAIADAVNVGRAKVSTRLGGIGLVLETLGPTDGAALLDSLQAMTGTVPALKWAWYLIELGELDFGSAATRGMIDELVAQGAMPAIVGTLLKGVAESDDLVTAEQIEVAMKDETGAYK